MVVVEAKAMAAGYYANGWQYFTHGPARMYMKYGDAKWLDLVRGYRDWPAYSQADSLSYTIDYGTGDMLQRELAYHVFALVWGVRFGLSDRTARLSECREWLYEYMDFWVNGDWIGTTKEYHPFMCGITARAVIEDWGISGDARALQSVRDLCDLMWDEYHPATAGMFYNANPHYTSEGGVSGSAKSTTGSPVLNNLIGPAYAWVALQLRDSEPTAAREYMRRADLMFAGSATVNNQVGKQFNQQHTWVFDQLRWRNEFYNPPPKRSGRIGRVV